jgi:hypothetical protein
MSILTFFATQRRCWFNRMGSYSAEYFAGAWAALLQAETVFKRTPLYNAHLETHTLQRELTLTKLEVQKLRRQLDNTEPQRIAARNMLKEANRVSQYDRRRAGLLRRTLERIHIVAGREEFEPEVRLRYLQQVIQTHVALERAENPDVKR